MSTSLQEREPLLQDDAPAGILTQYVIDDKTGEEYISNIPKYTGSEIPKILNRNRTFLPFELNYCDLKSFLENLGRYDGSSKWVVAGLLAETGIIWGVPVFGQVQSAIKLKKESKCTKQILCKRYGNQIVFLINVVDSDKLGLNSMFLNTIMVMTLPPTPSSSTPTDVPLPIPVPAGGLDSPHSRVSAYHVGVNNELTSFEVRRGIDFIGGHLSQKTTFVIDPNWVDDTVTVDWFGTKSLTNINDLIGSIGILDKYPPPPIGTGGKSRYSKKRVTKRRKTTKHRKSTKRRHRRTTRKPT